MWGEIGGQVVEVAFDTQSTGSLASSDLLPHGESFLEVPEEIRFGDHSSKTSGRMKLRVSIGEGIMSLDVAVIPGLAVPIVVGFKDMMEQNVCIMGRKMHIGKMEFELKDSGMFEPSESNGEAVDHHEVSSNVNSEPEQHLVRDERSEKIKVELDQAPAEEADDLVKLDPPPEAPNPQEHEEVRLKLQEAARGDPVLLQFVQENEGYFENKLSHPGKAQVFHRIDTGEASPSWEPPRRRSEQKQSFLLEMRKDWETRGILEPCNSSEWAANIHCAKDDSKPGGFRPCGDYRQLNRKTIPDRYPSDSMDKVYDFIRTADILTVGDGVEGYFTIPIAPSDRHKTAVYLPTSMETDGLFQLTVCLFGLRNAGATFDRWMNNTLSPFDDACSFRDDVFIRGRRMLGESDEHLQRRHLEQVKRVFKAIVDAGGRMKPKKLQLAMRSSEEVKALGFVFKNHTMMKRPEDINHIQDFPVPTTKNELQRFLGAVEWLRRFIPSLAKVEADLVHAGAMPEDIKLFNSQVRTTGQGRQKFDWNLTLNATQLQSFEKVKAVVAQEIQLSRFQGGDEWETHLFPDASGFALGSVLMQTRKNTNISCIVGCYSRKLTTAEQNYIPQEQELLAIYASIKHWDFYLEGRRVHVWSDHDPLKWLSKMVTEHKRGRIMRWFLFLQQFDLDIQHISGKKNEFADALSRADALQQQQTEVCLVTRVAGDESDTNDVILITEEQLGCPETTAIRYMLKHGDLPEAWTSSNTSRAKTVKKAIGKRMSSFTEQENTLFVCPDSESDNLALVVPVRVRRRLLELYHDTPTGAHRGVEKTLEKLKRRYWWPGMTKDIESYIKSCRKCDRTKRSWPEPGDLQPLEITRMFEHLHLDLIGPLPRSMSGNVYILSAVDRSTKRIVLVPLPNKEARTVARAVVSKIICWHGSSPATIQTDQGTEFVNNVVKNMTSLLGIHHVKGAAYRPQTNGQVERLNLPVEQILAIFTDTEQRTWDSYLDFAMFAINSSVSSATKETPDFLTWGRRSIEPLDLLMGVSRDDGMLKEQWLDRLKLARRIAARHNEEYNRKMKAQQDEGRVPHSIEVGDSVVVREMKVPEGLSKKLRPKTSDIDYKVEKLSGAGNKHVHLKSTSNPLDVRKVHVARVRLVPEEPKGIFGESEEQISQGDKGSDEWEIDRIIGHRSGKDGRREYLIRWKGFGPQDDKYVAEEDIQGKDSILEYHRHEENKKATFKKTYAEVLKENGKSLEAGKIREVRKSTRHRAPKKRFDL